MASLQLNESLPVITDLKSVILSDHALIDTRSPSEFAAGSFFNAKNLPLMDDADRHEIGKRYKQHGQDEAIVLGLQRVSGDIKAQRVAAWQTFVSQHPEGALFCFRGGLRSRITQQWIYEATGVAYPRIQGGYKALRRFLLEQLDVLPAQYQSYVLSGRTGSGKTLLLKQFQQQVDLEGLANHRGSAFGNQVTPQPTQIAFENALAAVLLRHLECDQRQLLFEDEGRNVGSVHLPAAVLTDLREAPLLLLEVPDDERALISYQEYVVDTCQAFCHHYGEEQGSVQFQAYLLGSLEKIQRRLGGVRYAEVQKMMQQALAEQRASGLMEGHLSWVRYILFDYYDPMYDYQIASKQDRVIFQGDQQEIRDFLQQKGLA